MVVAALIAPRWFSADIRLAQGPIAARVEAYEGDTRIPVDLARVRVSLVGPNGLETARLIRIESSTPSGDPSLAIMVGRTPGPGWRTLALDLRETIAGGVRAKGNRASATYYLPAQSDDEAIRALGKQWIGRKVWLLGAGTWEALWDPRLPATILGVERRRMGLTTVQSSFYWDYRTSNLRSSYFVAGDPLAIRVRLPVNGRLASGGMDDHGPIFRALLPEQPAASKANEDTILVTDPWHFARAATFVSPDFILKNERPRIRQAFIGRRIVPGMPRTLVARILGEPDVVSPRPIVWKQRLWTYAMNAPFQFRIEFDPKGRVASSSLEGRLP